MALQEEFNEEADEWFQLENGSFPLIPRDESRPVIAMRGMIKLPVSDTEGFRDNADLVEAALRIVSQSPTARRFAAVAINEGYTLRVDPPQISGAGPEFAADTQGNTDHENKRINVKSGGDPLALALVIAHELAHVSQIAEGGLDLRVSAMHPLASIRQLLAMEGDARAYELLIAAELAYKSKDDPEERLLFPQMLDVAAETIGVNLGRKIVANAKTALAAGGAPEEWMARIFKCFYFSPGLRRHYENTILFSLETLEARQPGILKDEKLFRGETTREELIARLDSRGRPYLAAHEKGFLDVGDERVSGVCRDTHERLKQFENMRRENPATLNDKPWSGPVYELIAVPAAPQAPAPKPPAP